MELPIQANLTATFICFNHFCLIAEFYKGANQFGIALSIPVYSIDRLIIESLLESTHSIAADVLATIDNAVMERINVKDDSLPESSDIEGFYKLTHFFRN